MLKYLTALMINKEIICPLLIKTNYSMFNLWINFKDVHNFCSTFFHRSTQNETVNVKRATQISYDVSEATTLPFVMGEQLTIDNNLMYDTSAVSFKCLI